MRFDDRVTFLCGPGMMSVYIWEDLWAAMFRVLAFAMYIVQHGACRCGCVIRDCDYCAYECDVVEASQ